MQYLEDGALAGGTARVPPGQLEQNLSLRREVRAEQVYAYDVGGTDEMVQAKHGVFRRTRKHHVALDSVTSHGAPRAKSRTAGGREGPSRGLQAERVAAHE